MLKKLHAWAFGTYWHAFIFGQLYTGASLLLMGVLMWVTPAEVKGRVWPALLTVIVVGIGALGGFCGHFAGMIIPVEKRPKAKWNRIMSLTMTSLWIMLTWLLIH